MTLQAKIIIYFYVDIHAPTSTANTPSSVDNQSSTSTPPIASNPSHSSTKSSCQQNIPNDLLCESFYCKIKVVIRHCTLTLCNIMEKHFSSLDKQPKKRYLMTLLHPIKYMWNTIGEQLEVRYGDIKSAEYNESYDHTRKLSEVLQVWRDKRTCLVCWQTIITVVEEPPVENKAVADEIYQFLTRPDIQNEYLSSHHQTGKMIFIIYKNVLCHHSRSNDKYF